jgi:hypothetical protein
MSTAYIFDANIARAPFRRLSSVKPGTEGSQSDIRALARIFAICATAVTVVAAPHLIHVDNPTINDGRCTLTASLHNALVRPVVSPLADERDWLTHGLPDLREPTTADCADKQ